jgi:hypothetical protein
MVSPEQWLWQKKKSTQQTQSLRPPSTRIQTFLQALWYQLSETLIHVFTFLYSKIANNLFRFPAPATKFNFFFTHIAAHLLGSTSTRHYKVNEQNKQLTCNVTPTWVWIFAFWFVLSICTILILITLRSCFKNKVLPLIHTSFTHLFPYAYTAPTFAAWKQHNGTKYCSRGMRLNIWQCQLIVFKGGHRVVTCQIRLDREDSQSQQS